MRETIARGLAAIEHLSPIEAAVLANILSGAASFDSHDPHAVIAAGVRSVVLGAPHDAGHVERVRAAFAELGFEVSLSGKPSSAWIAPHTGAAPVELDTPEALAERYLDNDDIYVEAIVLDTENVVAGAIRARDQQVSAKCRELAEAADREAQAHEAQTNGRYTSTSLEYAEKCARVARCEGQATALRALATMLDGPRDGSKPAT